MSTLSTHILDTAHGTPAAGVRLRLLKEGAIVFEGETNADGRIEGGLGDIEAGKYRLELEVADYFRTLGVRLPEPPFLDVVAIEFGISEVGGHYHVPLLVSPFGYSTYRGS